MIPVSIAFSREYLERAIGRLPRHVAYPLILLISIVLWLPIGIAAVRWIG